MEYYEDFLKSLLKLFNGKTTNKKSEKNKDVIMNGEEIKNILDFLKVNHFTSYLIFRIFAETRICKSELINFDYNKINLDKRFIDTYDKRGRKVYYISQELVDYIKFILIQECLKI